MGTAPCHVVMVVVVVAVVEDVGEDISETEGSGEEGERGGRSRRSRRETPPVTTAVRRHGKGRETKSSRGTQQGSGVRRLGGRWRGAVKRRRSHGTARLPYDCAAFLVLCGRRARMHGNRISPRLRRTRSHRRRPTAHRDVQFAPLPSSHSPTHLRRWQSLQEGVLVATPAVYSSSV